MARFPMPRLLPVTMLAMVALLAVKSNALVRAAAASTEPPPAKPAPAMPAAKAPDPLPAKPVEKPVETPAAVEPPVSESERGLLGDLRQRRLALDAREAALTTREAALAAVDRRLQARVDELTALQTRLETLETQRKQRDESNWQGLVKLYETMKPRDAAVIFNDLDLPVLLPVLDRMKEAKAAPIVAAMAPERARQVTAELARMRLKNNRPGGG
jgi:flagellar motility protein MotE (MotC chaperone)